MIIIALLVFQSPSNRVKCSDTEYLRRTDGRNEVFQSPSNRVKCSDLS